MVSLTLAPKRIVRGETLDKMQVGLLFLLSVAIAGVFTMYHITANASLFYVGLVILFASSILLKTENFLVVFIFLIPNVYIVKKIDVATAFIGYAFLISIIKYVLTSKNKNVPLVLAFHCLFAMVPIVGYFDLSLLSSLIRFIAVALFMFIFIGSDCYKDENYKKQLIKAFIFGTVYNVAAGLLYYNINSLNLFWMSFSGIRSDRNYFSSVVASCLAITFAYAMYSKKRLIYLLAFVFLLFGGLLSGSRAFMVSLVWIFIMLLSFLFSKKYWKQCLIIFLAFLILSFLLKDQLLPAAERLLTRFGEDNLSSGSGRIDSWKYYLGIFTDNPFNFFFGSSSQIPRYGGESGIVQHNTFIQALSEIGLFGTVSFFAVFLTLYKKMLSKKSIKLVFFGPLLVILTCYFFINAMYSDSFTVIVFLSFVLMDLNSKAKE